MIENLTNKTFHKKIQNQLCIDELIFDKALSPQNQSKEKIFKTNILLNSLQDFIKRCETNYGKLYYEKNYLISLNEIIILIQNSILTQQQLDQYIFNKEEEDDKESNYMKIKSLNEKFINDLNYNIFSIEKINNNYYSFNNIKKKRINNKKAENSKDQVTPHNIKSKINSIFNNIYKEVFVNGSVFLNDNNNAKEVNTFKEKIKSDRERNKSAVTNINNIYSLKNKCNFKKIKNNKSKKIKKKILMNETSSNNNKKKNNVNELITINGNINIVNLSNEERNISQITSGEITNNIKNRNTVLKINNTARTIKSHKSINKLDIYKICQNMKKIKKDKNGNNGQIMRSNSSYYINDINNFNDTFLRNSLKSLGFSQVDEKNNATIGIKKIIVSNAYRPSNFTSQLLDKGKKYINDFKKLDNEENKKRYIKS